MLGKNFKIWPADLIFDAILLTLGMHFTNLGFLKDKLFCFIKLPNDSIKESNKTLKRLDNATAISDSNNKYPSDLTNLETKWAKKKEEKTQKC